MDVLFSYGAVLKLRYGDCTLYLLEVVVKQSFKLRYDCRSSDTVVKAVVRWSNYGFQRSGMVVVAVVDWTW